MEGLPSDIAVVAGKGVCRAGGSGLQTKDAGVCVYREDLALGSQRLGSGGQQHCEFDAAIRVHVLGVERQCGSCGLCSHAHQSTRRGVSITRSS